MLFLFLKTEFCAFCARKVLNFDINSIGSKAKGWKKIIFCLIWYLNLYGNLLKFDLDLDIFVRVLYMHRSE